MRRLTSLVARSDDHEDGAVAVLVAILSIVLFGMVALAVDVGALYQERRELQNGADAGALAIAEDCVRDVIDCIVGGIEEEVLADGTAQDYADENAEDQASHVENVDLDAASGTVTVDLLSEDSGGDTVLYHWFAPVLGIEASEVRATATAAWGPPAGLRIFPLSFCIGKYNEHIDNDTDYGPPPYNIYYDNQNDDVDCELADDSENANYSGGFGWIDIEEYAVENCHLTASEDEWYDGKTGIAAKQSPHHGWSHCWDFLEDKARAVDESPESDPCSEPEDNEDVKPILVPIFDQHRGDGDSGEIHVDGFGAFCPTGFHFGGSTNYPDNGVCDDLPRNRCIRGWFTDYIEIGEVATGGHEDFGVETFGLID